MFDNLLNKKKNISSLFDSVTTILAIGISLGLAFIIIFAISDNPFEAIKALLIGPFSSVRNFGTVIEMAITISFTGVAVCIMFQASQFNMGAEGAFFLGALTTAAVSTMLNLTPFFSIFISIICSATVGALICFIPAFLKTKFNASEMVSSLMLNYVSLFLGLFFLNYFLRDTNFGMLATEKIETAKKFEQFIPKTRIHTGIFIVILVIIFAYFFIYKTSTGYKIRCVGNNEKFANYSGIKVGTAVVVSQLIGGAIAGLGGSVEILGMYDRFQWTSLPGYGWDGIIIAILARNKPQHVPIAAFGLSYLRIGSSIMARVSDVPNELISVIQAIMIMLVTSTALLASWKQKQIIKETLANG